MAPTAINRHNRQHWLSPVHSHAVAAPLLFLTLGFVAQPLPAAYITDRVVAPLYKKADGKGKPIQVLSTGMPVDIIDSEGDKVEVRTADGSRGWIEQIYVTEEKPARSAVLTLQSEKRELQTRLTQLESDLADTHALLGEQQALVKELTLNLEAVGADPVPATIAIADALPTVSSVAIPTAGGGNEPWRVPYWVYGLIAALCLLLGAVAGIALMDALQRRRHGGFRL